MKKTRILAISIFAILMMQNFTACGQPDPGKSSVTQGSQTASVASTGSDENVESKTPTDPIRILLSEGGSAKALEAGIGHFTEDTGIKVEVLKYPYAEVREKQMLDVTSKTGDIDVITVDGPIWLSEFSPFLDSIEPYIKKENYDYSGIIPSMVDMFKKDGTLYGLPVRIGGWVLIYRKDLFDANNLTPPKTMNEFLSIAQTLTTKDTYGFTGAFKQTNYLVAQWAPFLYSFGGNFLDPEMKKAAFNSPQGIASVQFLVDLYSKYKVINPSAIDYEQNNIITAMQQGVSAMAITYSPYYLEMDNAEKSKFTGKFAVAPMLPYAEGSGLSTGVTEISGWGIAINKFGKNKDAAWELMKYMSSDKAQLKMAVESKNSPTSAAVYNSQNYLNIYKEAPAVLSALQSAKTRPGSPVWTQIEDILARELSAAISSTKTVEQALADAENEVNALLQ